MTFNALSPSRLNQLSQNYNTGEQPAGEQFINAFQRYFKTNRESLLDITITVTSATLLVEDSLSELDPLLVKAIQVTNPSLNDVGFLSLSGDEIQGAVNSAKGKYFEYLVVDRLNRGEQVGPVHLPEGYYAVLADSLNQPGWDMQIIGPDGTTSDYLQLKVTDSVGYIREALNSYPDIEILSTSEVATSGLVLDSGVTEDNLREQVSFAVGVMDESTTSQFLDYFSPLLPLMAIVTIEGRKLLVGSQSLDKFKQSLARRGQRIFAANFAGAAIYAIGGGVLAIPSGFVGGLLFDHYWNKEAIVTSYLGQTERLLLMRLAQQSRILAKEDP